MIRMYRAFAGDYAVKGYAEFVRLLLQGNKKAMLWHCTAGKDRAGTAAVIIEEILGIPREVIIADYLTTTSLCSTCSAQMRTSLRPTTKLLRINTAVWTP